MEGGNGEVQEWSETEVEPTCYKKIDHSIGFGNNNTFDYGITKTI